MCCSLVDCDTVGTLSTGVQSMIGESSKSLDTCCSTGVSSMADLLPSRSSVSSCFLAKMQQIVRNSDSRTFLRARQCGVLAVQLAVLVVALFDPWECAIVATWLSFGRIAHERRRHTFGAAICLRHRLRRVLLGDLVQYATRIAERRAAREQRQTRFRLDWLQIDRVVLGEERLLRQGVLPQVFGERGRRAREF